MRNIDNSLSIEATAVCLFAIALVLIGMIGLDAGIEWVNLL